MSVLSTVSEFVGYDQTASNAVSITVNGNQISGWGRVSIRMGVDIMPWTAMLETTLYQPDTGSSVDIPSGSACVLSIGGDKVLTGYVQSVSEELTSQEHVYRVVIASRSVDLVECSAEFSTYQMNNTTALGIAQQVCQPFGISVSAVGGAGDIQIQQFSVILTETAYEVIERVCRLAGCIFYDQPDGSIVLSPVGTTVASGGVQQGVNMERLVSLSSLEGRFSNVQAIIQNPAILFTPPSDGDKLSQQMQAQTAPAEASASDPDVPRRRPLLIPVELGDADYSVARKRVQWEVARRYGRSQAIETTVSSWRDGSGTLWMPNTLIPLTRASRSRNDLLLGELELVQGEDGTHANMVLMPSSAFVPEPLVLPVEQNEAIAAVSRD
ncbi:phage baseplate assembly protein [Acetobacter oryzifermentans]|uniref:phage baseplate assembly protein n=1 Tax=Acetobacter oryzifermentans TaxID=1633874 RepID=UPI0039BFD83D